MNRRPINGHPIPGGSSGLRAAGFVLAGGNSRRMGRDKALIELASGGPSLLEHAAQTVQQAVGNVTVIGAPERYVSLGWPVVADVVAGIGPLGGLLTLLRLAQAEWNLAVACDMPGITVELLRGLMDNVENQTMDCVVSEDASGQLHPLCAIYHRRCLPVVERMISDKCFTLHKLLDNLRAKHLLVEDNLLLRNVNSPFDLEPPGTVAPLT